MTNQILGLRQHLLEADVTMVVIEATGDYWRPFYYLLEADIPVMLVNAHEAKNVPGRNTDVSDAAWLADLGRTVWSEPHSFHRSRSGRSAV